MIRSRSKDRFGRQGGRPRARGAAPAAAAVAACVAATAGPALGTPPVARVLLKEGDVAAGLDPAYTVRSLACPAVNRAEGWAVWVEASSTNSALHCIWGDTGGAGPSVLRLQGLRSGLRQRSLERRFGLADSGAVVYSPDLVLTAPGFMDSVWIDETPIAIQGGRIHGLVGEWYWRSTSHTGVTAAGQPYWIAGIADSPSRLARTLSRGLFFGSTAQPLLVHGTPIANLGAQLDFTATVGPQIVFAPSGQHYVAKVRLADAPAGAEEAVVLNGDGLVAGAGVVRAGELLNLPGGRPDERWRRFGPMGVNSAGRWFLAAETDASDGLNAVLVTDGRVAHREGGTLDGRTLAGWSGGLRSGVINDNGDLALVWPTGDGSGQTLFVNDRRVLSTGDAVDLDGDGEADPSATVVSLLALDGLALSDRTLAGEVAVYAVATLEVSGVPGGSDHRAALLRLAFAPVAGCRADFNADGVVNSTDLSAFVTAWNTDVANGTRHADFNSDGVVNSTDLSAFITVWLAEAGEGCAP